MKTVFVIGSLNMDLVIETSSFPRPGETLSGIDFFTNPGGKGANQAVASAKQGAKTVMLGAIGRDVFGQEIIKSVSNYGVNCNHVLSIAGPSGIAMITLCEGDNRIITYGGANHMYKMEEAVAVLRDKAKKGDILLIQFEIPESIITGIIPLAHKIGMMVIVNPAPAHYVLSDKILANIDLLIANEWELESLTKGTKGAINHHKNAQNLIDRGVRTVIVTLGCQGGLYHDGTSIKSYSAQRVNAVDTTAAGDAFVGTIAAELSYGATIDQAIERAAKCAAITVTRKGAMQSIPSRAEVDCFVF